MYRLLVYVILIANSEQRHARSEDSLEIPHNDEDNINKDIKPVSVEERALVQPLDIKLRDKFTDLYAIDKETLKKKKKDKPKQAPKKKEKVKKSNDNKSKNKSKKKSKESTKPNHGSNKIKVTIDGNVINIKSDLKINTPRVVIDYDDGSSEEESSKTKQVCNICGWIPDVKWPPFNPPSWPFH